MARSSRYLRERQRAARSGRGVARRRPPGPTRREFHRSRADADPLDHPARRPGCRQDLADDPGTGKRRDLGFEEEQAFWTWGIVEILRSSGVRIEELLEISHHSLVQYRLPTTGQLVPLLQIAPSKTDEERLLPVGG